MRLRVAAAVLLAACDFGVDLTGLSDGAADVQPPNEAGADAANDVVGIDVVLDAPTPNVPITAIDVGAAHACGLRNDGTVVCWGANSSGQLGNGASLDSSTPVQVLGLT